MNSHVHPKEAFQSDMLSPGNVCVDSHDNFIPTRLAVHLKQSKMDPFGAGTTIHLGMLQLAQLGPSGL